MVKYLATQAKDDSKVFIHGEIGYNYRLTNIQAAMGCAQMEWLDRHVTAKRRIADNYTSALRSLPGITPMSEAPWAFGTYWLYTVLVETDQFEMDSRALMCKLGRARIQSRPIWQPMHLSKPHASCQAFGGQVAERLYQSAISLPCSVELTNADQERVIRAITELMNHS